MMTSVSAIMAMRGRRLRVTAVRGALGAYGCGCGRHRRLVPPDLQRVARPAGLRSRALVRAGLRVLPQRAADPAADLLAGDIFPDLPRGSVPAAWMVTPGSCSPQSSSARSGDRSARRHCARWWSTSAPAQMNIRPTALKAARDWHHHQGSPPLQGHAAQKPEHERDDSAGSRWRGTSRSSPPVTAPRSAPPTSAATSAPDQERGRGERRRLDPASCGTASSRCCQTAASRWRRSPSDASMFVKGSPEDSSTG